MRAIGLSLIEKKIQIPSEVEVEIRNSRVKGLVVESNLEIIGQKYVKATSAGKI